VDDPELDKNVALNLIHAPVFYGMTFSAWVELEGQADAAALKKATENAGFGIASGEEAAPCNVSVAGETSVMLREPEPDSMGQAWWFWGAADNLRLPAWSASKLAERLEG
jgi:hypothetical protein